MFTYVISHFVFLTCPTRPNHLFETTKVFNQPAGLEDGWVNGGLKNSLSTNGSSVDHFPPKLTQTNAHTPSVEGVQ